MTNKIGRNAACPCGSGKKFKFCCAGTVDWDHILSHGEPYNHHLSIRGRNIAFINKLADALQLDSLTNVPEYKAAFTPNAVRKIHEAVTEIWPQGMDITSALKPSKSGISGLYIGDYRNEAIFKGIVRHSVYATKILLIDPFMYPASFRDEFNPVLNPAQHRAQTLKNANFWLSLAPWIEAGIIEVIRTPADFDRRLQWESMQRQRQKFEENAELKAALEDSVKQMKAKYSDQEAFRHLILFAPDEYLGRVYKKLKLDHKEVSLEQMLAYVHRKREEDLDFLEPASYGKENGQLHSYTTGANYEIAKMTSDLTGSYLVTDIPSRWKEIEFDRRSQNSINQEWAPFAKAFQDLDLKFLNNIKLQHAFALRQDERLEGLRVFLRKVWKSAQTPDLFDRGNAILLAEELTEEVRKAEDEWKKIDQDLLKWFGAELGAGLVSAEPLISSGNAHFLTAAIVSISAIAFGVKRAERSSFPTRFPAAFFMNLK